MKSTILLGVSVLLGLTLARPQAEDQGKEVEKLRNSHCEAGAITAAIAQFHINKTQCLTILKDCGGGGGVTVSTAYDAYVASLAVCAPYEFTQAAINTPEGKRFEEKQIKKIFNDAHEQACLQVAKSSNLNQEKCGNIAEPYISSSTAANKDKNNAGNGDKNTTGDGDKDTADLTAAGPQAEKQLGTEDLVRNHCKELSTSYADLGIEEKPCVDILKPCAGADFSSPFNGYSSAFGPCSEGKLAEVAKKAASNEKIGEANIKICQGQAESQKVPDTCFLGLRNDKKLGSIAGNRDKNIAGDGDKDTTDDCD
ncbi:hypothetical protein CDD83_9973 [Cordyceps sp. RAO-2017]|nr:hypothetical protein CDD83_9973 [Cordyceps sp. RAO-2017]